MQLPRSSSPAEQYRSSWPFTALAEATTHIGAAGALNVLVVEDDDPVRNACAELAQTLGCRVLTASLLRDARPLLEGSRLDFVLLDLQLPDGSGASLLEQIRRNHPRATVTVMSAHATVTLAMDVMAKGASHVLQKPFSLSQLKSAFDLAIQRRQASDSSRALQDKLEAGLAPGQLIARSPGMKNVLSMISRVASSRTPVLITGEPGSGKETVARTIHANGSHATSPFLPVDCDALDSSRLETELFGDPASSDSSRRFGLLAAVGEGTLYLSEVAALSPPLQARLLRTLENRRVRSGFDGLEVPFRARTLASSTEPLEPLVLAGRFRRDLYIKLNTTHLRLPPLRERQEDLMLLAECFLEEHRREHGTHFAFSEHASSSMVQYSWPNNVAELEAAIAHACSLANGSVVHLEELASPIRAHDQLAAEAAVAPDTTRAFPTLEEREKQAIVDAMGLARADKSVAAKLLGIGKTTLYRKLKEYSLADELH